MRIATAVTAAVLVAAASPAAAQLRNRSISLESGASVPLSGRAGAAPAVALAATAWLEGAAEATARVSLAAAPQTGDRAPALAASGTIGMRLSLLPDPIRPQLGLELGWARVPGPAGPEDRLAFAVAAGLEWFPVRDLSVAARSAVRGAGGALSIELMLGAAAYF